jgi:hypothetical protein
LLPVLNPLCCFRNIAFHRAKERMPAQEAGATKTLWNPKRYSTADVQPVHDRKAKKPWR